MPNDLARKISKQSALKALRSEVDRESPLSNATINAGTSKENFVRLIAR